MNQPIQGLHHVTAVARDPQRNVDFYRQVLGQRLVKTTVNFDDPGTYHFYYGDEVGTPGSVLTFFPWPHVVRGRAGNGETAATAYAISPNSIGFWADHLNKHGVILHEITGRFGADVISLDDPDGMRLELIVSEKPATHKFWQEGPIPAQHALRGFHSVTLWLNKVEPTAELLTRQLGYSLAGQEGGRFRFTAAGGGMGAYLDIVERPGKGNGRFGAGSIHHIAFRTANDEEQRLYLAQLRAAGYQVTTVQDRQYFRSIYFRSPGGVLFEIATDAPGFLLDETVAELGNSLKLPPWLEPRRAMIEQVLPVITRQPNIETAVPTDSTAYAESRS